MNRPSNTGGSAAHGRPSRFWSVLGATLLAIAFSSAALAQTKANDVRKPPAEVVEDQVGPLKQGATPGCVLDRAVDARTLVVRIDGQAHRVRMLGIEAMPGADANLAAMDFVGNLLGGETLSVVVPAGLGVAKDAVPWVMLRREPEGLDVGLELIRQGFAKLDSKFDELAAGLPPATADQYRKAAEKARELKKGLWDPKRKPRPEATRPSEAATEPKPEAKPDAKPDAKPESKPDAGGGKGSVPGKADPAQTTMVLVTPNGKKYHLEGCKFLSKNARPISLEEARKSYQPCSSCNPPK